VLFYAPSGAGKSSLINARLLPALRDEGFAVLGTVRVGGQLPDKLPLKRAELTSTSSTCCATWPMSGATAPCSPPNGCQIISPRCPADPARPDRMLILDQFEEIFTTYEDQWEKREDFFPPAQPGAGRRPAPVGDAHTPRGLYRRA
jgi:hypothetical protein